MPESKSSNLLKKFYLAVLLIAFTLAVGIYIFFSTEKPIYQATGKFTYYYQNANSYMTAVIPFTSDSLTKSISDSVATRSFVDNLYTAANIKFSQSALNDVSRLIKSRVLTDSNVIQVDLFSTNKDSLNRISKQFFNTLEKSPVMNDNVLNPQLRVIDDFYILDAPSYPKPLEYSALVFIGVLLVGLMFLYIFSSNEP